MRFEQVVPPVADDDLMRVTEARRRLRLLLERGSDVEVSAQQQDRDVRAYLTAEAVA
jgi:hypothetical protein